MRSNIYDINAPQQFPLAKIMFNNMSANCSSSLYINEYAATRTGNFFTCGGMTYTSDE